MEGLCGTVGARKDCERLLVGTDRNCAENDTDSCIRSGMFAEKAVSLEFCGNIGKKMDLCGTGIDRNDGGRLLVSTVQKYGGKEVRMI